MVDHLKAYVSHQFYGGSYVMRAQNTVCCQHTTHNAIKRFRTKISMVLVLKNGASFFYLFHRISYQL